MAEPLSADRFLALVKARGVGVQEEAGWKTHNRNEQGPWGAVHGVLLHHNAGSGQVKSDVAYARKGSRDLPGPLYAGLVAPDGILHMVGWGRANHAGKGDGDVLRAVIAEKATLPPDDQADTDGNRHFYGFSFITKADGSAPITVEAQRTMALVAYVICKHHNWTERSVIAHADWQPGKPDPAPHPSIRRQVQALVAGFLKTGAPGKPPEPPEAPSTVEELTEVVEQLTARVADLEEWRNWRG